MFKPFRPHPLVQGGHMQTIMARYNPPKFKIISESLFITLSDGDCVYFKINEPADAQPTTPCVALFHGLAGCSDASYNLRLAKKLTSIGYRVARFNHRGCGDASKAMARKIYHSGSFDDMHAGLRALNQKWPDAPLYVVGFSLSGAILLNLLGLNPDLGDSVSNLKGAAAVCPPVNLESCSQQITKVKNKLYDRYFTKHLVNHVRQRRLEFPDAPDANFSRFLNLRKFDEEFTAVHGGFKSRSDYYERCSPGRVVSQIKVPTLVIAAKDDPIVTVKDFSSTDFSKSVSVRIEPSGGHMGFISKDVTRFGDHRWLEEALVTWVENT
jgi:predicted alpha/beta-fold hydrolase